MPTRLHFHQTCSARSFNTQPKTVSWMTRETPARLRQPRVIGKLLPVLQAQKNRTATSNPNSARRCRLAADLLNYLAICSGISAPLAPTGHLSSARNRTGTPSRQTRQNRPRSAPSEAGRKTHDPRARHLRSGHHQIGFADRHPPYRHSANPVSPVPRNQRKPDFVNGLLRPSRCCRAFVVSNARLEGIVAANRSYTKIVLPRRGDPIDLPLG